MTAEDAHLLISTKNPGFNSAHITAPLHAEVLGEKATGDGLVKEFSQLTTEHLIGMRDRNLP